MEFVSVVVFYDITNDKLRSEFGNFLKDLGLDRIQKSAFMGEMRKDLLDNLFEKCSEFDEDTIHVILLWKCKKDAVKVFGEGWIPQDEDIVIL